MQDLDATLLTRRPPPTEPVLHARLTMALAVGAASLALVAARVFAQALVAVLA